MEEGTEDDFKFAFVLTIKEAEDLLYLVDEEVGEHTDMYDVTDLMLRISERVKKLRADFEAIRNETGNPYPFPPK